MKLVVDTVENCAAKAARHFVSLMVSKSNPVLGLATGSTPLKLYDELVRVHKAGILSFKKVRSFNLDEYVGLDGKDPQSYRYFMDKNLFSRIDIDRENTRVPNGVAEDLWSCATYDNEIEEAGGIDLMVLGIGNNGHIGFNEPCTPFNSVTHVQELMPSTREANARFFDSLDDVPLYAITMGLTTIMHCREIVLLAFGQEKAEAVASMIAGPITEDVPASILQLHPNCTVYMDKEAASLL